MVAVARCWLYQMKVIGLDLYNINETGSVAKTMTSGRNDKSNIPCVFIVNSSGDGVAGTLDSSYYKGQGERQGIEREYIVIGGHGEQDDTESKFWGDSIHYVTTRLQRTDGGDI